LLNILTVPFLTFKPFLTVLKYFKTLFNLKKRFLKLSFKPFPPYLPLYFSIFTPFLSFFSLFFFFLFFLFQLQGKKLKKF